MNTFAKNDHAAIEAKALRYRGFVDTLDSSGLIQEFTQCGLKYHGKPLHLPTARNIRYLMERFIRVVRDRKLVAEMKLCLVTLDQGIAEVLEQQGFHYQESSDSRLALGAKGLP